MKSTIYILLIILIATSFTSCKKDCEKSNSGTLIIDNYASDPYDIYVDDVYQGDISSYGKRTITSFKAGYHYIIMVNQNDFTIQSSDGSVPQCGTFTVDIY